MRILWTIGSLNPEKGGPVFALKQFAVALTALGNPCEVITLDLETDPWIRDFPGVVHALGPSRGKYGFNTSPGTMVA